MKEFERPEIFILYFSEEIVLTVSPGQEGQPDPTNPDTDINIKQ